MLLVFIDERGRKLRASLKQIDDHIDLIVAGAMAYLDEHRKGMGQAERLGRAN